MPIAWRVALYHVRIITVNKNLPHLPTLPTLALIMGIQPDLILQLI
ncbi:MAG: hypothetical protein F6J90_17765 [Moorea sp. SIOASIH]|nr:hypothetical protein [Moorena sp. SIOASIH]